MLSMFETDEEIEENERARRDSVKDDYPFELDDGNHSPTTQRNRVLSSLTVLRVETSDDEDDMGGTCACGGTVFSLPGEDLPLKTCPITDRYRVSHEIIGEGESGRVMACYRISDGAKFALKVLRDCPKARREAELHLLTHEHPNILSIEDLYENTFGGVKCLLMVVEFLEGGDLLSQFESQGSKPYSEEKVGKIMASIGAAVRHLHELNIAHRDIKLENILCSSKDEDCVYKLGDFGFAKMPEKNTMMQSPCCTPFYAPPEVIGHERYNKACDMWSMGVAMYILLSGYPPFYSMKGLQMSPGMKSRISQGYYAFPHNEWDIISEGTKTVVRSLLKTVPRDRLTIEEFMDTLFVKGETNDDTPPMAISTDSATVTPDTLAPPPNNLLKPIRSIKENSKLFRLHSIQEEILRVKEASVPRHTSTANCNIPSIPA